MVAGNVVLAIFGDIEPEKVADMAERAFRRIPKGVKPAPEHAPAAPNLPARLLTKEPKEQAVIMMGFPGIAVKDPRSDSLELLLAAMNGLSSELMLSIREERGLAYYAGVYQQIGLDPGLLVIYAGARSDKMQEVEELIEAERKRVTTAGLRPDEFKRARQRLLASHQRSLQSNSDIAMNCALDELCGLGYNCSFELEKRLATLTPEIVRNAAASLLLTNSVAVSIVLPMSSETSESEAVQTTEQETEK